MIEPRITDLVLQFLSEYERNHSPRTTQVMKKALARFQRTTRREHLSEIDAQDYVRFLGGASPWIAQAYLTKWRVFVEWAERKTGVFPYVPPRTKRQEQRACNPAPTLAASVDRLRLEQRVAAAAKRLKHPWQRAIFLCGFLYGWTIRKVSRVSLGELLQQPMRADLGSALTRLAALMPEQRPFFKPWLGTSEHTYTKRWHEWVGELEFEDVVVAGEYARTACNIRPTRVNSHSNPLLRAMPEMTEERLRRMPWPFGGEDA